MKLVVAESEASRLLSAPQQRSRPYRNGRETAKEKHFFFLFCLCFPFSMHQCIEICIRGPSKTAILSFLFFVFFMDSFVHHSLQLVSSSSKITTHKKHKGKTSGGNINIRVLSSVFPFIDSTSLYMKWDCL